MPTLSSLIVQREIASMRAVEEAISRQVIHGGDLPTNLLELGAVKEEALTWVLAESFGLEPAPVGSLPPPESAPLKMVPGDMALRHGLFPLSLKDRTLVVAIAEPLSPAVEEDLSFALDVNIRQVASPLVRVREAIAANYGIPLDRRYLRLVSKLDGYAEASESVAPPPPERAVGSFELPRPSSMPPATFSSGVLTDPPKPPAVPREVRFDEVSEAAPPPATPPPATPPPAPAPPDVEESPLPPASRGSRQMAGWLMRTAVDQRRAHAVPKRRKGAFTRADAESELEAGTSSEEVLDVLLSFAHQYFEYAAVFALHGDLAEGRDALGGGASRDKVLAIGVPLEFPSLFRTARERGAAVVDRVVAGGLDAELLTDLERMPADIADKGKVAVIPVVVRRRTVALLLGDDGTADVTYEGIGDVITISSAVAGALERIILSKKRGGKGGGGGGSARPSRPPSVRPPKAPVDARAGREALASAIGDARLQPTQFMPQVSPEAVSVSQAEASSQGIGHQATEIASRKSEASDAPRAGSAPPGVSPVARSEIPGRGNPPTPEEHHWSAPSEHEALPGFAPLPAGTLAVRPLSERPLRREDDDEGPEGAEILMAAEPTPSPSRRVRSSTNASAPPSDKPDDLRTLLHRAAGGGEGGEAAFAQLLMMAESNIRAVVGLFPGPLSVDRYRTREELPPASKCGPLLELITVLGRQALPQMTVKSASSDPDQRFWATHTLGELRYQESASALIARLFDDDVSVRRVARRSAAALVAAGEPGDPLVRFLDDMSRNPDEPVQRRSMAIETMGEIRVGRMVPPLIAALDATSAELRDTARRALVLATRQDFGSDVDRWTAWWSEHGGRHRIEWLIEALMHEDPGLRRAAGEELKSLTKEYFGYYDDLPARERERAQARYFEWWDAEGQRRFV